MAEIPNFPEDLLHLHHAWHNHPAHPELPGRVIPYPQPGSGAEFLIFHRDFVRKFHDWYDGQPFANPAAVAPWSAIPAELKVPEAGWNQVTMGQEQRILTNNPPFADYDALGIEIEGGIHNNFLHSAAAMIYHDELVRSPATSPRSTLFYKIHGLVSHWWLLRFPFSFQLKTSLTKPELDTPPSFKTALDTPPPGTKMSITKAELDTPPLAKGALDTPKPLTKVEIEFVPGQQSLDQAGFVSLFSDLSRRLQTLEGEVARGNAFIRATERPNVGGLAGQGEQVQGGGG